jgi:hypothetical protein
MTLLVIPDLERAFIDAIEAGKIDGDKVAVDAKGEPVKIPHPSASTRIRERREP